MRRSDSGFRSLEVGSALLVLALMAVFVADTALQVHAQGGRFVDGKLTIRDTQTNLMWEKKDSAGGLHDVSNVYTWCQATGNTEGLCAGAVSWIAQVNKEKFAGSSDWRIPTVKELSTIVDKASKGCGRGSPCIDPIFGSSKAFRYWAADDPRRTSRGSVDFSTGDTHQDHQLNQFHVRAVRTAQ